MPLIDKPSVESHNCFVANKKKERMATRKMMKDAITVFLVGLVLVSNMVEPASGTASAPKVDCSSLSVTTADCLSFLTSGSTVQEPEGSCCSGLKTMLEIDAECVCKGFQNSVQAGITLNVTKALTLPAACHVSAPSISDCGMNIKLNGAAAVSPTASSPTSGEAAPPTSSETTDVTGAPPPGSSGSSALGAASVGSFLLGLLVAYFTHLY